MNITKKIGIFIVTFVLAGIAIGAFFPKEEKRNDEALIRVGSGDDVSGVLMNETVKELSSTYIIKEKLESSSFQDC